MSKDEIENVPIEEDALFDDVPSMLIEELELSGRAQRCLAELGVVTVADLGSVSLAQLQALPRTGKKTVEEIVATAEAQGLTLDEGLLLADAKTTTPKKPVDQPVSKPEKKSRKPRQLRLSAATASPHVIVDVAVQILSNGNNLHVLRRLNTSDLKGGTSSALVKAFLEDCQQDVDAASS